MPKRGGTGRSGRRHTLRTTRGTTYIGGGRRTYHRNAGGIVSKRGAYRPAQKKNFMRKRAAVVETKRKTRESLRDASFWSGSKPADALVTFEDRMAFQVQDSEIVHMNPQTFYWWSQGLDQSQHIGQCVTVKYLSQKVQVRFPQHCMSTPGASGTNLIVPTIPQKYELIWGWIPAPRNLTGQTSPPVNQVTVSEMDSYVNNRIKDYYNDRKDKLRFIPRKDVTIRISGKKTIRPDLRYSSTAPLVSEEEAGTKYTAGTIPDWYGQVSWKMPNGGKKVWFEQSGNLTGTPGDVIGMFPNFSWLPFCALVNWNHSEIKATHPSNSINYMPAVSSNDIVYFTDS